MLNRNKSWRFPIVDLAHVHDSAQCTKKPLIHVAEGREVRVRCVSSCPSMKNVDKKTERRCSGVEEVREDRKVEHPIVGILKGTAQRSSRWRSLNTLCKKEG